MLWRLTLDVCANPFQGCLNVQDAEVLRVAFLLQLCGVRGREDAFTSVEADINHSLASKVVALKLGVATGARDHSTAVDVYEDLRVR